MTASEKTRKVMKTRKVGRATKTEKVGAAIFLECLIVPSSRPF
jgi:hypothetical protein